MRLPDHVRKQVLTAQKNEITEYHIYKRLSLAVNHEANSRILNSIADDERHHAEFWSGHTGRDVKPNRWKMFLYYWISRLFGLTFGIKLMEHGEERAKVNYDEIALHIPQAKSIRDDEDAHEMKLIGMINEEKLEYAGSIVLGLNDALVELTGALAGLTFALQNTKLIALAGLVTGIAASLSMAASEYLSTSTEGRTANALKAAVYTGAAYIITVILLVLPYFLLRNYYACLLFTLLIAVAIIFFFNYYISIAKDYNFRKRFLEMAGLSLGVAVITFIIGIVVRSVLGIEV